MTTPTLAHAQGATHSAAAPINAQPFVKTPMVGAYLLVLAHLPTTGTRQARIITASTGQACYDIARSEFTGAWQYTAHPLCDAEHATWLRLQTGCIVRISQLGPGTSTVGVQHWQRHSNSFGGTPRRIAVAAIAGVVPTPRIGHVHDSAPGVPRLAMCGERRLGTLVSHGKAVNCPRCLALGAAK